MARIAEIRSPEKATDPAYAVGLRAALDAGLDYGIEAIAAPNREPVPVPVELLTQARLAARSGVSLDAVLRRYSAGHSLLSDGLLEEAAALGLGAAELKSSLQALAARYDRIVAAVSEEYEREAVTEPRGTERRRCAFLRRLLAGERLDTSTLGYGLELNHVALVASGSGAAAALADLGRGLDRRLLLAEPDSHLAWAWFGGKGAFSDEEMELIRLFPWPDGCAVACGEIANGPDGWRLSHRQAGAALPVAQRSGEALVRYSDVALLAAALNDDLLCASLHRSCIEPLEVGKDNGSTAKATLRAYFSAARNTSSAAAALGVSRRTVANRLESVETRLNRSLGTVAVELEVALRLDALDMHRVSRDELVTRVGEV